MAFRARVRDEDVYHEGITRLRARDFQYAEELGYAIKLLALASQEDHEIQVRVHPALVPADVLMAKVTGVFNAVEIQADLAGRIMFHGRGAGSLPTASAVMADVVDIARNVAGHVTPPPPVVLAEDIRVRAMSELETRYYLRVTVKDQPGVLAQITRILGDLEISIDSIIQKGTDETTRQAELVLMTHRANEEAVQQAVELIESLSVVSNIGNLIRVEDWPEA